MARRGRSLRFEEDEVQDLVVLQYGDKRTVMSLLYSFTDPRNNFHLDHVFPKSRFTAAKLAKAGITGELADTSADHANRLANLQLLEGTTNQEKNAALPADWAKAQFPGESDRKAYLDRHDLGELPTSLAEFGAFYDARRTRMAARLRQLLGVPSATDALFE